MKALLIGLMAFGSISSFASSLQIDSKTFVIYSPRHLESQLPISYSSDQDGVCVYLGFDKGLKGSKRKDVWTSATGDIKNIKLASVKLDINGSLIKQSVAHVLRSLTCVDN